MLKMLPSTMAIVLFILNIQNSFCQTLIFDEEFNTLDVNVWNHLVTVWRGGNNEFEYYRNNRTNSYAANGILYIRPTLTADQYGDAFLQSGTLDLTNEGCNMEPCSVTGGSDIVNPIQSARMQTINSFSFTYGQVDVRAKMPRGDWLWPAIWFQPTESVYGTWPRSGEIDLAEVRGNNGFYNPANGENYGNDFLGSTLHWGLDSTSDQWQKTYWTTTLYDTDFAADFHNYTLVWQPTYFNFSLDGQQYGYFQVPEGGFWQLGGFSGTNIWGSNPNAPFDQEFYITLNLAVGGNFFPDGWTNDNYPKPWSASSPTQMRDFWNAEGSWYPTWNVQSTDDCLQIDYIRVYSL